MQRNETSAPAVARGAVINLLGNVAGLLDPAFLAAVSWLLGADVLGRYVLATTYVAMLMRLCVMGLDKGLMRHVPLARAQGDDGAALASALGTSARFAVGLALVGAALVFALSDFIVRAGGDDPAGGGGHWLAWLVLAAPFQALATVSLFALRGRSLMLPFVAVRNTLTPFLLFLIAVPAIALGGGERWLIAAYLGAQISAALVAVVWFSRGFPEVTLGAMLRAPRDRRLLAFSFPQGLTEFLNLLLSRSDILMIALFFPDDPELVAVYAVASMLAGVVKKVRQGFDNSLAPALSTLIEGDDRETLQATYAQVARWVFALWIPLAAALGLAAPLLLSLFGADFPRYWMVVPILMVGRLLNAAGGPAQIALLMSGRSRLELLNNAAINGLNIAANALMIPRYGVVGAALATAFAMTVFNAVRVLQVRRLVGIGPAAGQTLRLCAALLLSLAPPLLLLARSGGGAEPELLTHGLATVAFLLAYPLWLWTLGLRQELSAIGRFLRRQPVAQS